MKRSDKRKNLLTTPDQSERIANLAGRLNRETASPAPEKKAMGRPPGKRSDKKNYQPVTTFLKIDNYQDAQKALIGSKRDFGDLVDELLEAWLAENGHRK